MIPCTEDTSVQQPITIGEDVADLQQRIAQLERALNTSRKQQHWKRELAAKVHSSLLPGPVRDRRILVDLRYVPIEEVGGDYCQVQFSDWNTCYIAVCDVSGHGVGAALLATRVSSEVRQSIVYGRPPRDVLRSLNRFICENFSETGLFLSLVVAQIDLERRSVTWSGAGHPETLLIRRDPHAVETLPSQNPVIGVMKDCLDDEPQHTLPLAPGDRLLFYTDGLTETVDHRDRRLGTAGLADIAAGTKHADLFETPDLILDQVTRYQHGPTTDDKTLIVAEIK